MAKSPATAPEGIDIAALRENLLRAIASDAVEHGVVAVAFRCEHPEDADLDDVDMLLGVDGDLFEFRMNAHGRIARRAYQQGLHGAVSAETVSALEEKFGGIKNFFTEPQTVELYKLEGSRFVAA